MTRYLLAGGGTAGHVNPLLAVADRLRAEEPEAQIVVVGTAEGLESRLVPQRGYPFEVIPKVPFPRRPNQQLWGFLPRLRQAIDLVVAIIEREQIDVVVGFGGYVSTPVYLAARRSKRPIVIHEANAKPGLANRLGARFTPWVGVAFAGTPLPHATVVGMPLRPEIEALAQQPNVRARYRAEALSSFGFDGSKPVLVVTGGSLGARRINQTIRDSSAALVAAGWDVLHLVGGNPEVDDPQLPGYHQLRYLDRMELALAVADFALSRAGASTVSELSAAGIATAYVPYAVGNGEQRLNAQPLVDAGAALLVDDAECTPDWVLGKLIPLLADTAQLERMRAAARAHGVVDGTARTVSLIHAALA